MNTTPSEMASSWRDTAAQPETRRRPPQSDAELMTEKLVLGFEPASRLEYVGDENFERMQDRKHRSE